MVVARPRVTPNRPGASPKKWDSKNRQYTSVGSVSTKASLVSTSSSSNEAPSYLKLHETSLLSPSSLFAIAGHTRYSGRPTMVPRDAPSNPPPPSLLYAAEPENKEDDEKKDKPAEAPVPIKEEPEEEIPQALKRPAPDAPQAPCKRKAVSDFDPLSVTNPRCNHASPMACGRLSFTPMVDVADPVDVVTPANLLTTPMPPPPARPTPAVTTPPTNNVAATPVNLVTPLTSINLVTPQLTSVNLVTPAPAPPAAATPPPAAATPPPAVTKAASKVRALHLYRIMCHE